MNTLWLQDTAPAICQASVNSDVKHSKGDLKNIQNQPVASCTIFPFPLSQASYGKIPVLINSNAGTSPSTEQNSHMWSSLPTQLNLNHIESYIKKKKKNSSEILTQPFPHQNLISLPKLESSLAKWQPAITDLEISQPLQKKASVIYANLYKAAHCEAMYQPFIILPL